MAVSTAVSRVTGFARTWATAYALGVTLVAASYSVANNIPNMVFELVAGGVLSSIFIPVLIERGSLHGEDDAWRFASYTLNLTMLVLGLVALAGTIWAGPFVRTQTFRISAEEARLATFFFSFFAIQALFYGMNAVFTGVLHSHRRFVAPAVAPIFNNLVVIVTLLGFYVPFRESRPELAATGLAIGTSLGVLTMALVQLPGLRAIGWKHTFRVDLSHPGLRTMVRLMGPSLLYVAVNVVGVSFRNAYAFEVSPSGPATLLYAWMFYQLPYGIFAVALATAIFPELADRASQADWPGFAAMFERGLRATALAIMPTSAMLIVLAEPLVTVYRAGRFTAQDVPEVARVLAAWGFGLFFYAAFMYILRSFYSVKDPKTPAATNLGFTTLQVALYAVLTVGVGSWRGLGLLGVPVADAVFFSTQGMLLILLLRSRFPDIRLRPAAGALLRVLLASVLGGVVAAAALYLARDLTHVRAGFLIQLAVSASLGLTSCYLLCWALGIEEVPRVAAGLRDRLARSLGRS